MSLGAAETTSRGGRTVLRGLGYVLLWAGGTILLYVAWLLWFTGVETAAVQQDLLEGFDGFETVAADDPVVAAGPGDAADGSAASDVGEVSIGSGVAVLEFERPGSADRPVRDEPVVVVEGTSVSALRAGPGHYSFTADPGARGNFAVAGHRTTYGAPFYDIEQIAPGDLVHVTTRDGTRYSYEVLGESSGGGRPGQHIVTPGETWVLDADPLGTGGRILTLTTCHPRFSAAYRLVVFGRLVETTPA